MGVSAIRFPNLRALFGGQAPRHTAIWDVSGQRLPESCANIPDYHKERWVEQGLLKVEGPTNGVSKFFGLLSYDYSTGMSGHGHGMISLEIGKLMEFSRLISQDFEGTSVTALESFFCQNRNLFLDPDKPFKGLDFVPVANGQPALFSVPSSIQPPASLAGSSLFTTIGGFENNGEEEGQLALELAPKIGETINQMLGQKTAQIDGVAYIEARLIYAATLNGWQISRERPVVWIGNSFSDGPLSPDQNGYYYFDGTLYNKATEADTNVLTSGSRIKSSYASLSYGFRANQEHSVSWRYPVD